MNTTKPDKTKLGAVQRDELFAALREFLLERPDEDDYARVAHGLGMRRNTLAVAVHRLRHRLRELVEAELAQTTCNEDQFHDEMRELRTALDAAMG